MEYHQWLILVRYYYYKKDVDNEFLNNVFTWLDFSFDYFQHEYIVSTIGLNTRYASQRHKYILHVMTNPAC